VSRAPIVSLTLILSATCGDQSPDPAGILQRDWRSESAYRFGDVMTGGALFGHIYVRVTADNQCVFVLEPFQSRVSIWTPDGRRLVDLGRSGEGPGDFSHPHRVDLDDSGFYIRDQQRISYFSYDGSLLRTVPNLPASVSYQGFPIRTYVFLEDGSFLGVPGISTRVRFGHWGDDPIHTKPVLRVRRSDKGWLQEELLRYDFRTATMAIPYRDGYYHAGQPYADSDWYRLDREAASVVLARSAGDDLQGGEADLIEVNATGDTVWRRRLELEAAKLSQAMLDATMDSLVDVVMKEMEVGRGRARDLAEEALYAPEYLPSVRSFMLSASSGQVWLRSQERVDTLSVWYSIERGDTVMPPRRVLLPESIVLTDATETHVWGVWKDQLDVSHVVGRRLVPPS